MMAKTTIAIVGAAEKMGQQLAIKLAAAQCRVLLISPDKIQLTTLIKEILANLPNADVEAIDCVKDACWEADVIVLAVDASVEEVVAEKIRQVATQKVVVHIIDLENKASFTSTTTEALQKALPYSKIVTVITNTITYPGTAVTGSDGEAVQTILQLAAAVGCDTVVPQYL